MDKEQVFEFDFVTPGLNGSDGLIREHWSKRKKRLDNYIMLTWSQKKKSHKGKVRVVYERHSVTPMDWDNLCASFKLWGDSLVKAKVIKDDNPLVVTEFVPRFVKAKNNKESKTIIRISDLE